MDKRFFLIILLVLLAALPVAEAEKSATLYFFYSTTCPHCTAEKPFLEELEGRYPQLEVRYLEAGKNMELFREMAEDYGTSASGVPRTFTGDKVFVGFSEDDCNLTYLQSYNGFRGCKNQIENCVRDCLNLSCKLPGDNAIQISQNNSEVREFLSENSNAIATLVEENRMYFVGWWSIDRIKSDLSYPDIVARVDGNSGKILGVEVPESNEYGFEKPELSKINWIWTGFLLLMIVYLLSYLVLNRRLRVEGRHWLIGFAVVLIMGLFALAITTPEGEIEKFASGFPFPGFVFVIALADGFNPCAFTVLIVLLSLLTHTKSRSKMLLIGSVFILTSAAMYFFFIMVILTASSWIFSQYGEILFRLIGIIILSAGAINLKDYFFLGKGPSLSMSSEKRGKIFGRAGKIVRGVERAKDRRTLALAILATAGLAALVNLVELGCTAMFPMVYMASLFNTHGNSLGLMHVLYTALYSIAYIIPLSAILVSFVYTFKSERLSEKQARILKLVSGLLMLCFGLVMILKPELLVFG